MFSQTCPNCGAVADLAAEQCLQCNAVFSDYHGSPDLPKRSIWPPVLFICGAVLFFYLLNLWLMRHGRVYEGMPTTFNGMLYAMACTLLLGALGEYGLSRLDGWYKPGPTSLAAFIVEYVVLFGLLTGMSVSWSVLSGSYLSKELITSSICAFGAFFAIFFHELGHYVVARRYGYDPKMVSTRWLYKNNWPVYQRRGIHGSYTLAAVVYSGPKRHWITAAGPIANVVLIAGCLMLIWVLAKLEHRFDKDSSLFLTLVVGSIMTVFFNFLFFLFNMNELWEDKGK